MLKVVVYDCCYGGEFFADRLESELPVMEVIRVIDWRCADKIQSNPKAAREIAKNDLLPYIGHVDLIILANHLLTLTSLKYFRRKYKNQRFVGLNLRKPTSPPKKNAVILTTKAVTRTIGYYGFKFRLRNKTTTVTLDNWLSKIDDGELTKQEIKDTLDHFITYGTRSQEIFLGCSQFFELKPEISEMFGRNIKIHDGFSDAYKEICRTLQIRGAKKKSK